MHRSVIAQLLFIFFAASSTLTAISQDRVKNLPEKYRQWLEEEVTYLISEVERETLLSLETETEREAFVEAFWRRRDTNPTPLENEFKAEHYSRLARVDDRPGEIFHHPRCSQRSAGLFLRRRNLPNRALVLQQAGIKKTRAPAFLLSALFPSPRFR